MQEAVSKALSKLRILPSPSPHLAAFHSTPLSLDKWKERWNHRDKGGSAHEQSKDKGGSAHEQSKSYLRYSVRQKRAYAKKALKDYLLYGKTSKLHFQDQDGDFHKKRNSSRKAKLDNRPHYFDIFTQMKNPGNSKPSSASAKGKRWRNNPSFIDNEDFGPSETIFQSTFGGCRGFTFSSWENCRDEPTGFDGRDESRRERTQKRVWNESDDDQTIDVGSTSHRLALDLPLTGPLKLDDVKSAFRASAMKWHPDKHQGSLQGVAEERFKLCVDAYNSLCSALKSA